MARRSRARCAVSGSSAGDRIGVVGWKALLAEEWSGLRPAIFAPAFFVDTLRELAVTARTSLTSRPALTSPTTGLRELPERRPDRDLRVGRGPMLGVGARDHRCGAARRQRTRGVPRRRRGPASRSAATRCSRPGPTSPSVCAARARAASSSVTPRWPASACGAATARVAAWSPASAGDLTAASDGLPGAADHPLLAGDGHLV